MLIYINAYARRGRKAGHRGGYRLGPISGAKDLPV
jgi:hypothetical protein